MEYLQKAFRLIEQQDIAQFFQFIKSFVGEFTPI